MSHSPITVSPVKASPSQSLSTPACADSPLAMTPSLSPTEGAAAPQEHVGFAQEGSAQQLLGQELARAKVKGVWLRWQQQHRARSQVVMWGQKATGSVGTVGQGELGRAGMAAPVIAKVNLVSRAWERASGEGAAAAPCSDSQRLPCPCHGTKPWVLHGTTSTAPWALRGATDPQGSARGTAGSSTLGITWHH